MIKIEMQTIVTTTHTTGYDMEVEAYWIECESKVILLVDGVLIGFLNLCQNTEQSAQLAAEELYKGGGVRL